MKHSLRLQQVNVISNLTIRDAQCQIIENIKKSKAHSKQHWLDTEMALTKLRLPQPQKGSPKATSLEKLRVYRKGYKCKKNNSYMIIYITFQLLSKKSWKSQ
jgi:hypothetical protein